MKRVAAGFLIFSTLAFGDALDEMKQKVESINRGIEASTQRISNIEVEKERTEDRVTRLEREIGKVEAEIGDLTGQITSLSRRVDYSERSLRFSSREEEVKLEEYNAKLAAWNRSQKHSDDTAYFSMNKKKFKELLYSDLERMEQIRSVQKDLDIRRIDIERDRRQLSTLKAQLLRKEKQNQKNRTELGRLIKQLEAEKKQHTTKISSLQGEKKRIEAQIEKIIKERARSVKNVNMTTAKSRVGRLRKPVSGSYTTTFGKVKKGNVRSSGIEIRAALGRIVRGAAGGKVIYAGKFQGLGQVVMVDYGYNMIGIYGNLISVDVKVGDDVKKADKLGILGLSIDAVPDLYYELRFNLKPINPVSMF